MVGTLLVVSGLLNAVLVGLKVIAPRTKTPVDDKVLAVLDKYGVPLVEYLAALSGAAEAKPDSKPRLQSRDHRTK